MNSTPIVATSKDKSPSGTNDSVPIRMVLAKCGLDAHERGVHVVALGLREAGFEVIYLGLRRSPQQIMRAAVQEDADVIGVSSLSGGHRDFMLKLLKLHQQAESTAIIVLGGLIPNKDQRMLFGAGVQKIFGQGSLVTDMAVDLRQAVELKNRSAAEGIS